MRTQVMSTLSFSFLPPLGAPNRTWIALARPNEKKGVTVRREQRISTESKTAQASLLHLVSHPNNTAKPRVKRSNRHNIVILYTHSKDLIADRLPIHY